MSPFSSRAIQLRKMTRDMLANMSPQERDRMMQQHLAQARGPIGNVVLLRQMTATLLRMRKAAETARASSSDEVKPQSREARHDQRPPR